MLTKLFSKLHKSKKYNCLLITPPLLEPNTYYVANPVLTGQLIHNGFEAKNYDLNIRFFKAILTKEYIEKTEKLLKKKQIDYNKEEIKYLTENLENALKTYKEEFEDTEKIAKAEEIINKVLCFISLPYPYLKLRQLKCFEECYSEFGKDWDNIKSISTDCSQNIFLDFFEEAAKEIKKLKPDLITITIPFSGNIIPAFTLAKILKEKTSSHITLGGNFLKSENIINHPEILDIYCDSVLIGDGEESIVKLTSALSGNKSKEDINGIIYKDKNKTVYNPPKQITNMNNIANVSFEGLDLNGYMKDSPCIYMIISKGCYWGKCNFCGLGPKYERYCIKTPQKAVADIKELKEKYDFKGWIVFQDDALHPTYLNKLADELLKEKADICYSIFGRLEPEFTKELLQKLYDSGLRSVYWGLESGCQKTLNDMNKGIKLENVPRILKDAYDIGISNMVGIIVNFPTETMKEYNETIDFLETIKQYVTISPGNFSVMKNSVIAKNCDDYDVKILGTKEFSYCPIWEAKNISEDEKEHKWQHFCECVKNSQFKIDSNKQV